ncbi:hypothetical protein G6F22_001835 [Rhizopus arrhizus]|nr:hypothetical protein G6F22_001835 [Rhizopus arrhizus]KAG0916021.1 hypothetical protein G6F33_002786 [Rhizopus arrhizus]
MYILFISSQHPIIINNYYSPIAPWPSYKLRNMFHHLSSQEIEEIMKDCKNDEDEAVLKLMTQTDYLSSIRKGIVTASQPSPQPKIQLPTPHPTPQPIPLIKEEDSTIAVPKSPKNEDNNRTISEKTAASPKITIDHDPMKGRLSLDDALKQIQNRPDAAYAGWSEARVRAYKMIDKNPNSYYYRFNAPGEAQRKGKWTKEETELFLDRLKQVGANAQWGLFSIAIPGRVGYQCSNYYRFLIESGQIQDPNYVIDSNGKARYLFDKKTPFLADLDDLLTKLAQARDSETIRNATLVLNTQYYITAECVPALVEIIARSPHFQVRQLAAVELRKKINKWWSQIQETIKVNLRSQLLTILLDEKNVNVRNSVARVISSVASIDMPDNKWPALLDFLHQSCASNIPVHRETGLYCLYSLFEAIADIFMNNVESLFELFNKSINDQESKQVKVTTVLVLGKLSESLDNEDKNTIKMFKAIIPNMVNVLEQCIKEEDTDNARKLFEVFDTLLMLDVHLLSEYLVNLIDFFIAIGTNRSLDSEMRIMALSFLMWAAIYKPNKIKQLKLVGLIIEKMMPIGTEEDPADIDEESPSRLAFKVLNAFANNIPPQQFFPIVMPFIQSYFQNSDPSYRKASMMAFAFIVEGCTDMIATKFNEVLPLVYNGLQDPEISVRRAGCMALGCLAEEIPTDISDHHQILLPLVFNLMNDTSTEVIKHACNALDAILDGLGTEIIQYLPLLMERLLFLLNNTNQNEIRATVIAAIGSAAHAAGENFHPYFMQFLPRIIQYISIQEAADDHLLCSVAMDAVGSIAEAVGADAFRPYTQEVMNLAIKQIYLGSSRLRECSFALFSKLVRIFGEEFAAFLPTIVPELLSSCKLEEKSETEVGEIDLTTDEMDDDDEFENYHFNSPLADEKELAAETLGELFENTKSHYLPYLDASLVELQKLTGHLSEGVRRSATQSLFTFLKTAYVMSDPVSWVPGTTYVVHESVQNLIDTIIPMTVEFWKEEEDRLTVAQTCQEFMNAIRLMGPIVINDCLEDVCNYLLEIYQKKSVCQQAFDDDDEYEEEEDLESETMLISSTSDLVAALCEAVGPNFSSSFEVYLPYILKYYTPTKSSTERAMAIGCLGQSITGIKFTITPHTERLLQVFIKACSDEDGCVRSNAAFALGCLALHTQIDLSTHYSQLLNALSPLFNAQNSFNTTDNAAGAVARLIIAHPEAVPLDQVLPVFINALPLKTDYEENEPVFECIFKLFGANNSFVFNNLAQLLHVFVKVLSDNDQLKEDIRNHLIELVRALNNQRPDMNIASSELARFL